MNKKLVITLGLILSVACTPVFAQSYSAALTSGLTSVTSSLVGNTYTWTLTNNSNLSNASWDVLAWSLIPYNVQVSTSITAPTGWSWTGSGWAQYGVTQNNKKYYTPPALGPGQSLVFTYTFDPNGAYINPAAGQGLVFLSHVGAVKPGSGDFTGTKKWKEMTVNGKKTWFDASTTVVPPPPPPAPVPEPATLALSGVGLAMVLKKRFKN